MRGGRTAQVIAQESMEEHIRGSVEKLDNQFSTLHQDVATLSCEVLYNIMLFQFFFYYFSSRQFFSIVRILNKKDSPVNEGRIQKIIPKVWKISGDVFLGLLMNVLKIPKN